MTLHEIVTDYIQKNRQRAQADICFFKSSGSLAEAIRNAVRPGGRKHDHQYRIPAALLDEVERRLLSLAGGLAEAGDFDALHELIEREAGALKGVGPLTVYDIAHRLGAYLGKEPKSVYLHSGTKEGAAPLGFRGKTLSPGLLPAAFSRLTPAEIEDCLCIYKHELAGNTPTPPHPKASSICIPGRPRPRPGC